MAKKYDSVISSYLDYWLVYVEMTKEHFWEIADSLREPRVWWIEDNKCWKDNIWCETSSYGETHIDGDKKKKFMKGRY